MTISRALQAKFQAIRFGSASRRVPASAVMGGYSRHDATRWSRLGAKLVLAFVAIFYGLAFGVTGTAFLMQLLLPMAAVAMLVIWLLPETGRPTHRLVEILFFAYMTVSMVWPDYLAIALPGLPWITMARLFALPLALFYLSSLSQSSGYRSEVKAVMHEVPLVWKAMATFTAVAAASILVADRPFESANRFFFALYAWVLIFFVASHIFKNPNRATWFCYLIWICAAVICAITVLEVRKQAVPWAGHIPSFLKIEDEAVQRMLSPKTRANTGAFRAQSKFGSPLSMAEFLALSVPFVMHIATYHHKIILRIAAAITVPCIVWAIIKTDARLGMIGFFIASLLFVLAWALMNVSKRKNSLFARIVLLGYPFGFAAFLVASLTITRIKNMVWGSSAYNNSNQARIDQLSDGLPKILERPWGYGIGRGGAELGYVNAGQTLTIDNYMLSISLEVGIIGLCAFVAMFAAAIVAAYREIPKRHDFETSLIVPATITLLNFLVIKFVLSLMENHTLFFAILGMCVALIYRIRSEKALQSSHSLNPISAFGVTPSRYSKA